MLELQTWVKDSVSTVSVINSTISAAMAIITNKSWDNSASVILPLGKIHRPITKTKTKVWCKINLQLSCRLGWLKILKKPVKNIGARFFGRLFSQIVQIFFHLVYFMVISIRATFFGSNGVGLGKNTNYGQKIDFCDFPITSNRGLKLWPQNCLG